MVLASVLRALASLLALCALVDGYRLDRYFYPDPINNTTAIKLPDGADPHPRNPIWFPFPPEKSRGCFKPVTRLTTFTRFHKDTWELQPGQPRIRLDLTPVDPMGSVYVDEDGLAVVHALRYKSWRDKIHFEWPFRLHLNGVTRFCYVHHGLFDENGRFCRPHGDNGTLRCAWETDPAPNWNIQTPTISHRQPLVLSWGKNKEWWMCLQGTPNKNSRRDTATLHYTFDQPHQFCRSVWMDTLLPAGHWVVDGSLSESYWWSWAKSYLDQKGPGIGAARGGLAKDDSINP